MKLNIHAILYLLCASVVTTECSNAAEAGKDVVYSPYGQEVNMNAFLKKCRHVVESIWNGSVGHEAGANFEEDLFDSWVYVDYYTRDQHQKWFITDDFVKALYDKMKRFKYYTPDGRKELPLDELIKSGCVGEFTIGDVKDLSLVDIGCAKLLCGIAAKIFFNNGKSQQCFDHILSLEYDLDVAGKVLTAESVNREMLEDHLVQKQMDIAQLADKGYVKYTDVKGVSNPKDYTHGNNSDKAFQSADLSRKIQVENISQAASRIDYGQNVTTKEINTNEYPIPVPKTDREWNELESIVNGDALTESGKSMIDDMLQMPELSDAQRTNLEALKEGATHKNWSEVCQSVKAFIEHNRLISMIRLIKPTSSDLRKSSQHDIQQQVDKEMDAAKRLNPEQKRTK